MSDAVILYNTEDGGTQLRLKIQDGTVWLSQAELAELFQTTPQNVTQHIRTIYGDGELERGATCKDFLQVQIEGERQVQRRVAVYRLEMVLAVGYRVRSPRGSQFRRWASTVLQDYLIKGFAIDDARLKEPAAGRNPNPTEDDGQRESVTEDASPIFVLTNKTNDVMAEACEIDGAFVVPAGSTARGPGSESWNSYRELREALIKVKTLHLDGKVFRFTRDTEFKSPSAASGVILDRNDNGRQSWRMKNDPKKTYADWQEEKPAAVSGQGGEA